MRQSLCNSMEHMCQDILRMGVLVEEAFRQAITALKEKDIVLARRVIEQDRSINQMELAIEDNCILLIAREQPVASDLRRIITGLKVVTQLERIGDHAVHVAKAVLRLASEEYRLNLVNLPLMAETAIAMLRGALNAFMENDAAKAKEIASQDDVIDNMHAQVLEEVLTYIMQNPSTIKQMNNFLFVSRFLERFGDHVTNICEWIVYSTTGEHVELNLS